MAEIGTGTEIQTDNDEKNDCFSRVGSEARQDRLKLLTLE
jgi:hypothetical protein